MPPTAVDGGIPTVTAPEALAGIPDTLRDELLARFNDVVRNYRHSHWESATLNAAKFCEVVYSILKGRADGRYPDHAGKPDNMWRACDDLAKTGEAVMGGRGMRILIPRAIPPVYEMRNNRGVGHVGSEVDPSHMDAEFALHSCQWILAELVRVYHQLKPAVARQIIDALIERTVPLIWVIGGTKRVLDPEMRVQDRVLVLLYGTAEAVHEPNLRRWAEYKNSSRFRDDILAELHANALIHFDKQTRLVSLSPLGRERVECDLLNSRVLAA